MGIQNQEPSVENSVRPSERWFIGFVWACVLILPLIFGEIFPFSAAPMFRDRPEVYCEYRVVSPAGEALDLKRFQLHRNYDGNPPGMGSGIPPTPSLDRFGQAPDMNRVKLHVQQRLSIVHPELAYVDVSQHVIGAIDDNRVGLLRETTIRVEQNAP